MRMLVSSGAEFPIIVSASKDSNPGFSPMSEIRPSHSQRRPGGTPWRSVVALVLLCVVAGVCMSLGLWQLDRAAERDTLHQAIEAGRQQEAIVLTALTPEEDLIPWRAAVSQGRWSHAHTVLLQNRNLNGQPGYWVATPLLLPAPPPSSNRLDAVLAGSAEPTLTGAEEGREFLSRGPVTQPTAVLVLRGWLPRDMRAGGTAPTLPREEGLLEVQGELHAHVPRIFELWEWAGGVDSQLPSRLPQANGEVPQVQNLDLQAYVQATGLVLLPIVLAQTSESVPLEHAQDGAAQAQPPLIREWPGPSLDADQNRGYALQWFSFSGIALVAALFVLRGLLRRGRAKDRSKEVS